MDSETEAATMGLVSVAVGEVEVPAMSNSGAGITAIAVGLWSMPEDTAKEVV